METKKEFDPSFQSALTGLGMERNYCFLSFPTEAEEELEEGYMHYMTPVGVAMALSWTFTGGSTSYMRTSLVEEGEAIGCLNVKGHVGQNAYTSACTAYKVAQQILLKKQPNNTLFANSLLCLHLPRGDGRSAGCTMTTCLLSLAMNKPVKNGLTMTGTVTLTGKILGIGCVKEKIIGAKQSQVKTIIFPEANRRDFDELEENFKEGIEVHFVDEYEQIFEIAFGYDKDDQIENEKVGTDDEQTQVVVAMALAMNSIDGLALYVKITLDEEQDEGCLQSMCQPGEDMQKSISIAYSFATNILLEKQPNNTFFNDAILSLYLPACSTNDGTSAGCTIITSFLSLAMNKPVRKDLAMAGTVTLTGKILGICSVKEKTIGARRSQVKTIIFPEANRRDFDELADNLKQGIDVHFVNEYEQIFELAFGYDPLKEDQTKLII